MKFKKHSNSKPLTASDYVGLPCTLTPYQRLQRWKANNPNHWYTLGKSNPSVPTSKQGEPQ